MEYLDLQILDAGFSVREICAIMSAADRVLHKDSDVRVKDIVRLTEEDLRKVRNCGIKTLASIKAKLGDMGLSLGMRELPEPSYHEEERKLWVQVALKMFEQSPKDPIGKALDAKLAADTFLKFYHDKYHSK